MATGNITGTYYSSDASIGYGAELRVGQDTAGGSGGGDTFVAIAQVASITFGEMTAGIVNKTHLRSPGRAHEKIATIRDFGPFQITGQLDMAHGSHNNAGGDGFTSGGLIAIHRTLSERNFEIEIPDASPATVMPFRGVISSLSLGELTLEGLQAFTASVQPLADYTADLP